MESSSQQSNPKHLLTHLKLRSTPGIWHRRIANEWIQVGSPVSAEQLTPFVALDPLLCVWILKRANGIYYGLRGTVDNLAHAIEVVGIDVVLGMIVDTVSSPDAPDSSEARQTADLLTRHSVATAHIAHWLDNQSRMAPGCAFTAGLLHDIGKHILTVNDPEGAGRIYSDSDIWHSLKGQDLKSLEQLTFGVDHIETGEFLGRKMYFPESLVAVLTGHHEPESLPPYHRAYRMNRIVNAASLCATALGYASGVSVSWDRCREDERWNTLLSEGLIEADNKDRLFDEMHNQITAIQTVLDPWVNRQTEHHDRPPRSSSRTTRHTSTQPF